jgi:hypothetical protein
LGDVRSDAFIGKLGGHQHLRLGPNFILNGSYGRDIEPSPYIWGFKLGMQPTPNLQFGVSITTVFAGLGRPLTLGTFLHTLSTSGNAQQLEPGDRRTGFDFSYRIPGLREWVVLYNGSMTEDEPNPIAYPRRSAMNPGIFLTRIPKLNKVDVHVETVYTNLPNDPRPAVFYTNYHYANGFTNNGRIIGSWVGPEARGYQIWSNYWRTGQSKVRVGYRRQRSDPSYIGGGILQDVQSSYDFMIHDRMSVSSGVQYERWNFPTLTHDSRSVFTVSLQIKYFPKSKSREHASASGSN